MTMQTRYDGSQYPCAEVDDAILAEENPTADRTDCGHSYHRTLGNLIISVLGGNELSESGDNDPEDWQTLENAMLLNTALEVKAIAAAHEYESSAGDVVDDFTHEEITRMLSSLARRLDAGRELSKRLRRARWGHPAFGGGEGWEAAQAAKKAAEDNSVKPQAAE